MEYLRDNENRSFPMPRPPIDIAPFLGAWRNTNDRPFWVTGLTVDEADGALAIRVHGGIHGSPDDWGIERSTHLYGMALDSAAGGAWRASFDLGFCTTDLEANLNQGLLVVVSFVRMKDGSARADRAVREFFHQV